MGKVTFYIDNMEVVAEEGQNLVDAAKENGITIPSLCYYKHIDPPLATCRICAVVVDGKSQAACLVKVRKDMQVVFDTPFLRDIRKAVLEMMYAEGNHFCPSCEKSGDCDLQHLGYTMGMRSLRFPHLFEDKIIDFNPERIILEHNRCILCRRCIEEVETDDGRKVFSSVNRGTDTKIAVDYEAEAALSQDQAIRAMHICPVGAIIVRGESMTRTPGDRKYDKAGEDTYIPVEKRETKIREHEGKKVIATTSLAGCFGCHMSMLDVDLDLLDIIELVEFHKSPLNDIKEFGKRVDVGLIEGGCCNAENIEVLRNFRKNCDVLISVGECAIFGGVPALRNNIPLEDCLEETYLHSLTSENNEQIIPGSEDLPKILDKVYACHDIVKIDYHIPGCPPSSDHIWTVVKNILFDQDQPVLYSDFKFD